MGRHKQQIVNGAEHQMKSVLAGLTEEVNSQLLACLWVHLPYKFSLKMFFFLILTTFYASFVP